MKACFETIYNELNLTKTREDIKIPLSAIDNKNVKIETMLSPLKKQISESDIAYVH